MVDGAYFITFLDAAFLLRHNEGCMESWKRGKSLKRFDVSSGILYSVSFSSDLYLFILKKVETRIFLKSKLEYGVGEREPGLHHPKKKRLLDIIFPVMNNWENKVVLDFFEV